MKICAATGNAGKLQRRGNGDSPLWRWTRHLSPAGESLSSQGEL